MGHRRAASPVRDAAYPCLDGSSILARLRIPHCEVLPGNHHLRGPGAVLRTCWPPFTSAGGFTRLRAGHVGQVRSHHLSCSYPASIRSTRKSTSISGSPTTSGGASARPWRRSPRGRRPPPPTVLHKSIGIEHHSVAGSRWKNLSAVAGWASRGGPGLPCADASGRVPGEISSGGGCPALLNTPCPVSGSMTAYATRGELLLVLGGAEQPVEAGQHRGGTRVVEREGAKSVADAAHSGRGQDALAHDVPDGHGEPVVRQAEHVVPVAADLHVTRRRVVAGGQDCMPGSWGRSLGRRLRCSSSAVRCSRSNSSARSTASAHWPASASRKTRSSSVISLGRVKEKRSAPIGRARPPAAAGPPRRAPRCAGRTGPLAVGRAAGAGCRGARRGTGGSRAPRPTSPSGH